MVLAMTYTKINSKSDNETKSYYEKLKKLTESVE